MAVDWSQFKPHAPSQPGQQPQQNQATDWAQFKPVAATQQPANQEVAETTLGEFAQGLALDVLGIGPQRAVKGISDLADLVGVPGAGWVSDQFQAGIDAGEALKPEAYRAQQRIGFVERDPAGNMTGLQAPSAEALLGNLGSSVAQIPFFLAGGGAARNAIAKGMTALGASERAATLGGLVAGYGGINAAITAPSEADAVYREALQNGATEEQAREAEATALQIMAPLAAITGGASAGLGVGAEPAKTLARAVARGALADTPFETVEEAGFSAAGDIAQGRPVNAANAIDAGLLGAAGGILQGGALGAAEYRPQQSSGARAENIAAAQAEFDVQAKAAADANGGSMPLAQSVAVAAEVAAKYGVTVQDILGGESKPDQETPEAGQQQEAPADLEADTGNDILDALRAAGIESAPTTEQGASPSPVAPAAGSQPGAAASPLGEQVAQAAPEPTAPAPTARTGAEAGSIIDRRLAALEEASQSGRMQPDQAKAANAELNELQAMLSEQDAKLAQGVNLAPADRLTPEERQFAEQRILEIRQALEAHRTAMGAQNELDTLRGKLSKIDADADLIALSQSLQPSQQPQAAAQPQAKAAQAPTQQTANPAPLGEQVAGPMPSTTQQAGAQQPTTGAQQPTTTAPQQPTAASPDALPEGVRPADRAGTVPERGKSEANLESTPDTQRLSDRLTRWLNRRGVRGEFRAKARTAASLPDALHRALQSLGRATGTRVVVIRNLTPDVETFNGATYGDGVLYVDDKADRPATLVAAHEWVHQLRQDDAPAYERLRDALIAAGGDVGRYIQKLQGEGNSRNADLDTEEFVADAVADALTDPKFLQRLADRSPSVFREVARAFLDFLDTMLGNIRDRGTNQYIRDVEAFRDELESMLADYETPDTEQQDGVDDGLRFNKRSKSGPQSASVVPIMSKEESAPSMKGKTQVAQFLQDRALEKRGRTLDINNEADRDLVAEDMVTEAIYEIENTDSAVEWYDDTIKKTMGQLALKHPEIDTDPDARTAFTIALAVTSQNMAVPDNLKAAEEVYAKFKSTKRFPIIGFGGKGGSMKKNFEVANKLLDKLGSMSEVRDFLATPMTVRQLNAMGFKKIGGELMDAEVLGSSVFGPKIGFGFYTNLTGNFAPVTMDMWFMRTVGRLTGRLMAYDPEKFGKQLDKLRAALGKPNAKKSALIKEAYSLAKAHEKDFKVNRALYDSGERKKSAATNAAINIVKSLKDTRDAPASGEERRLLRDIVDRALVKMKERTGRDVPAAAFQALIWYPEQDLYKQLGVKLKHVRQDYAKAAKQFLIKEGFNEAEIDRAAQRAIGRGAGRGSDRTGSGSGNARSGDGVQDRRGTRSDGGRSGQRVSAGEGRGRGGSGVSRDRGQAAGQTAGAEQEPSFQRLSRLPGAPKVQGFDGPDPALVDVAERYARENGIQLRRQSEYVQVDPERAQRIAAAYEAMPHAPRDPRVREAYADLIKQTLAQYRALERAGYRFWFIDPSTEAGQQYVQSPWNAMRDIRANKSMGVFPTLEGFGSNATDINVSGNPLLNDTGIKWPVGGPNGRRVPVLANDLFRAVHDAFGHGLEGAGFRADGEENAWQAHVRLFTGPAVAAITSETRGQNSWLNFGPYGEKNRKASAEDTVFADQKTGLMPEWTWTEGRAGDMPEPSFQRRSEKPFYSAMLRAVEEGKGAPKRADATAWKGWLDGAVRRGDFKQSERDWLGVDAWLEKQGTVTRDQLTEFVKANEVQIEEVVLGRGGFTPAMREELARLSDIRRSQRTPEQQARIDQLQDLANNEDKKHSGTKFSDYQAPGGENYRELLLTLPDKTGAFKSAEERLAEMNAFKSRMRDKYGPNWLNKATPEELEQNRVLSLSGADSAIAANKASYRSRHWSDVPNVLAHIRFNERTDADGKRVLFIQEIQSDWHQQGRKEGYGSKSADMPLVARKESNEYGEWFAVYTDRGHFVRNVTDAANEAQAIQSARDYIADGRSNRSVPDAPLKATDEWAMLAFKRAARWAVENDFDRIAWATGEQNAELFDLSKRISRVTYMERSERLTADDTSGNRAIDKSPVKPNELPDYIGKEAAERLMAAEPNSVGVRQLSGVDLKVGGEGMRGFYDKILPAAVSKWAKKFGAMVGRAFVPGKMGDWATDADGMQRRRPEQNEVHAIDITPAMREAVLAGQPLFNRRSKQEAEALADIKRDEANTNLGSPLASGAIGWSADKLKWVGPREIQRKARAALQDSMIALRDAQDGIEKALGKVLPDMQNAYRMENLMHGKVQAGVEDLDDRHIQPLFKAMRDAGVSVEQLDEYLMNRHAEERNREIAKINPAMPDAGSGIKTADARTYLAKANKAKLEPLARKVDAITRETRKRLLASGVLTQEAFDAMDGKYQHYVPLRGLDESKQVDEVSRNSGLGGAGFDLRGPGIKKALGRGEGNLAQNVLGEVLADAQRSILLAGKAATGRSIARMVLANPNPDLWVMEAVRTERDVDSQGLVYDKIMNESMQPDVIHVMIQGKPYRIRFANQNLADALRNVGGMGKFVQAPVIRQLAQLQRYAAATLTAWNPGFTAVNMARDLQFGTLRIATTDGAGVAAKVLLDYVPAMRAAWRSERGKAGNGRLDKWFAEFRKAGAKTGWAHVVMSDDLQALATWQAGTSNKAKVMRGLKALGDFIEGLNNAVENAMRLAYYANLRESGMSRDMAAERAKNLTVNFNRKGTLTPLASVGYIFFNPAVQGSHMLGKSLDPRTPNGKKLIAGMGAIAAAQFIAAMFAYGMEDDDGEPLANKVPDYIKERNFWLVTPEGRIITIPMAFGFNAFTYAASRTARLTVEDAKDVSSGARSVHAAAADYVGDLFRVTLDATFPIPLDQGIVGAMPITYLGQKANEIGRNKDNLGRDIAATKFLGPNDPEAYAGKPDTGEVYKSIAQALNFIGGGDEFTKPVAALDWAPEHIEHVANALWGGAGNFASSTVQYGYNAAFDPEANAERGVPILQTFTRPIPDSQVTASMFYDRKGQIESAEERIRSIAKAEGVDAASEYADSLPYMAGISITESRNGTITIRSGSSDVHEAYTHAEKIAREFRATRKGAFAEDNDWLSPTRDAALRRDRSEVVDAQKELLRAWREATSSAE